MDKVEIGQKWNDEDETKKDEDDVSDPCYPGDSSLQLLESDSIGDGLFRAQKSTQRRMAGSYRLTVGSSSPSSVKNQSHCRRAKQNVQQNSDISLYRDERKKLLLAEWESQRSCTDQACAWPCASCCLQRFWQELGQTQWPSYVAPSN